MTRSTETLGKCYLSNERSSMTMDFKYEADFVGDVLPITTKNAETTAPQLAGGPIVINAVNSFVSNEFVAHPFTNFSYDDDHTGLFMFYVYKIPHKGQRQPISLVALARYVKKLEITDIDSITKIGYGRYKIVFKNAAAANSLTSDDRDVAAVFQLLIFANFVSKWGIIYPVDEDIPLTEMEEHFYSLVSILKMFRVTLREGEAVLKVHDHIPFTQCYQCYRFNHVSNHCKQRLENCKQCFQIHDDGATCSLTIKCSNCKEDHCKAREKAYNIKRVVILENLSMSETKIKYPAIFFQQVLYAS